MGRFALLGCLGSLALLVSVFGCGPSGGAGDGAGDDGFEGSTAASDARDFVLKQAENQCLIIRECMQWQWNDAEFESVQDCADEQAPPDVVDMAEEYCPDYDVAMGNACLEQMAQEYETCTPAHDYDDADFDCQDDPCLNICGECTAGGWGN